MPVSYTHLRQYIKSFYTEDVDIQENIIRKEEHTDYVVKISGELDVYKRQI